MFKATVSDGDYDGRANRTVTLLVESFAHSSALSLGRSFLAFPPTVDPLGSDLPLLLASLVEAST